MTQELSAWQAYFETAIAKILPAIPAIDTGSLAEAASGWYAVSFNKAFSNVPKVVAVQGSRTLTSKNQALTPPKLTPPTLSAPTARAPSLATLDIPPPSNPGTWGDAAKAGVSGACDLILGNAPWPFSYATGYFCSALGNAASYIANAVQVLFYAATGDWSALATLVSQAVEKKVADDWDSYIANTLQPLVDTIYSDYNNGVKALTSDLNTGFRDLTGVAQDAVNAFYTLLNDAIGLAEGLSIPVAQIRNISTAGFEIYSPGADTNIYWIAALA